MNRFVIISGCSGGGKSTLLEELRRRGHSVVPEPGRRIIKQEHDSGGSALPWVDPVSFARRAIEMSVADRAAAGTAPGWVFFDRGLLDAIAALHHLTGEMAIDPHRPDCRYNAIVFLAPPWPEIYATDGERQHGLAEAIAEYDRLLRFYPQAGYYMRPLPRISVPERADFVLSTLKAAA